MQRAITTFDINHGGDLTQLIGGTQHHVARERDKSVMSHIILLLVDPFNL